MPTLNQLFLLPSTQNDCPKKKSLEWGFFQYLKTMSWPGCGRQVDVKASCHDNSCHDRNQEVETIARGQLVELTDEQRLKTLSALGFFSCSSSWGQEGTLLTVWTHIKGTGHHKYHRDISGHFNPCEDMMAGFPFYGWTFPFKQPF